jgi:hypothetical protein
MELEERSRSGRVNGLVLLDSQLRVADPILDWIETGVDYEPRVIAGAAGSGKTTVTQYIVKEARIAGKVLTAPTHKAVRVISTGINITTSTVQKLLGLRPNVDVEKFDINNPAFAMNGKLMIPDFKLIIVDESSMVTKSLFKILRELCIEYEVRLLFVGDRLQLLPINEKLSAVFRSPFLYNLDVIMRQGDNSPLKQMLAIARQDVQSRGNRLISYIYRSKDTMHDGQGFKLYNRKDRETEFVNTILADYNKADGIDDLRMCGHTNINTLGWNEYIRNGLIKHDGILLTEDDVVTGYSTIVNEFNEAYITNSEDYYVSEIGQTVNPNGLRGYIVKLKSAYDFKETPYLFILDHNDPANVAMFLNQMKSIIDNIYSLPKQRQGTAWKQKYYKDFKDKIILMKSFYDEYGELIIKKDLDYAYTLTIHKTQGSTYKNIYVNVLDILYNKNNLPVQDRDTRNRLLYVALSRASEQAHLLI